MNEENNATPSFDEMNAYFKDPLGGDFSLVDGTILLEQGPTEEEVLHDFCGYPRGETADLGAIEYSTSFEGPPCATKVKEMFERIP